jgi:hypothetical protein
MNLKATVLALGLAVVGLAGCETVDDGYSDGPRVYRSEPDYRYSERRIPPPYARDYRRDRYDDYDGPRRGRYDGGGRGRYDGDRDYRGDRGDDARRDDRNRPGRPDRAESRPPRRDDGSPGRPPRPPESAQNRPPREYTPPMRPTPATSNRGTQPDRGNDRSSPDLRRCPPINGQPQVCP